MSQQLSNKFCPNCGEKVLVTPCRGPCCEYSCTNCQKKFKSDIYGSLKELSYPYFLVKSQFHIFGSSGK
jgi:DNA-directed RNA polymerase subunit RPC12/RpoP